MGECFDDNFAVVDVVVDVVVDSGLVGIEYYNHIVSKNWIDQSVGGGENVGGGGVGVADIHCVVDFDPVVVDCYTDVVVDVDTHAQTGVVVVVRDQVVDIIGTGMMLVVGMLTSHVDTDIVVVGVD